MKSLLTRIRCDSGQAFVFVAVTLTVLVGMAALVIDGGSWYQSQRKLQTAADAAALAGAQHLPTEQSEARTVALDYAQKNYDGIPVPEVDFPDAGTINVSATAQAPGIFARIVDIDEVIVRAEAQARVFAPAQLKDVAPIGVHKDIACIVTDPTCFGQQKTLTFDEDSPFDPTKSKFGLLDLDRDGSAGAGDMKDWLENGYTDFLPIDEDYPPANGEKNGIKSLLEAIAKQNADAEEPDKRVLLFPVFDYANASTGYHVIGWAAFVIDEVGQWTGHDHELTGHFVTFIATDLAAGNPITDPDTDFGVHVITLTK
jgi:Putative Flp pilus-assembly TadE/G-like